MNSGKTYALLTAVGVYEDTKMKPLPCTQKDLDRMRQALLEGLGLEEDDIRIPGNDRVVTQYSFARSISEFARLMREEDTFIYYFSGHGRENELCFTDGAVTLESIVRYIDSLPAGRKLVILDCCYAGQADVPERTDWSVEGSMAVFAGKGIAVMASSAADHVSWMDEKTGCSVYTEIVAEAFMSRRRIRKGRLSLSEINEEVRILMGEWNHQYPAKAQQPIYRENLIGTIWFDVAEYHPYVPQKIFFETDSYIVHHVRPLHTASQKRLAVFVILKSPDDSLVPDVARQIVPQVRYADVYEGPSMEKHFRGKPADVIWCYFGHEEADLIRSNHFAYTIWTEDDRLRETYYRPNRNAEVVNDIYVFWNTSYEMVKKLQETEKAPDEIEADYDKLSNLLIRHAESLIKDLEEADNGVISMQTVLTANKNWIQEVKLLFFKLTSAEVPPLSMHDRAEVILDMAGWVVDMALFLERADDAAFKDVRWGLSNSIRRYHQALETLKG